MSVSGTGLPELVTRDEVLAWLGIRRNMLDRMIADGDFPRPIRLGTRSRRWRRCDLEQWLDAQLGDE